MLPSELAADISSMATLLIADIRHARWTEDPLSWIEAKLSTVRAPLKVHPNFRGSNSSLLKAKQGQNTNKLSKNLPEKLVKKPIKNGWKIKHKWSKWLIQVSRVQGNRFQTFFGFVFFGHFFPRRGSPHLSPAP